MTIYQAASFVLGMATACATVTLYRTCKKTTPQVDQPKLIPSAQVSIANSGRAAAAAKEGITPSNFATRVTAMQASFQTSPVSSVTIKEWFALRKAYNQQFNLTEKASVKKSFDVIAGLQSQVLSDPRVKKALAKQKVAKTKAEAPSAPKRPQAPTPSSNDPFISWVNNNRYLTPRTRDLILSAYKEASQISNPIEARKAFEERIRGFETNLFLTHENVHWAMREYVKFTQRISMGPLPTPTRHTLSRLPSLNSQKWVESFTAISRGPDPKTIRAKKGELLAMVRKGTVEAIQQGAYMANDCSVFLSRDLTNSMKDQTTLYTSSPISREMEPLDDITIQVVSGDVIDQAIKAKNEGFNPVFINMANAFHPGGSFEEDSPAQEENAFRRSNYLQSLYQKENPKFYARSKMEKYRIPVGGCVYTPHLQVFRGNEASGYPFLDEPVALAAIAIAAPDLNKDHYKGRPLPFAPGSTEHINHLENSIETFLGVAYNKGHDAVILSALGCGAFRNDPKFVAERFATVLQKPKWRGKFNCIRFAIFNDGQSKNLETFDKILNGKPVGQGTSYRG